MTRSIALLALFVCGFAPEPRRGSVELKILELVGARAVPARIHLYDPGGKPVQPPGYPFWKDHFVCDGSAKLTLAPGTYRYEIERGPEYDASVGDLVVHPDQDQTTGVAILRLVDLSKEGWWSGELHVHRPLEHVELLMKAEDLHAAPVITWWNARNLWKDKELPARPLVEFDGNRAYHVMAGEDEREGGALMYFGLKAPLEITGATREHPSPMTYVEEARKREGVHVDIEKPFWWDVPVWLASGKVDTIGIANNHMCRSLQHDQEAWGRPRDKARLAPPTGNGLWTQEIYYHALNCGLRLAPSAGSASGVLPNPVGYNRAYVHLDGPFSYDKWMEGLRAGRTFVTNGPLLRVKAGSQWPGHVFTSEAGGEVKVDLEVRLDGRDELEPLEIIRNGEVERTVEAAEAKRTGKLGAVTFKESGWFLVRARAKNAKTFRFASTAPFYVEVGPVKKRISRRSAQFFADWVEERVARIKLPPGDQRGEVLRPHEQARLFWRGLLDHATAD